MVCCFSRFRDQEFLKSLFLRKTKRKSPNSLRSDRVDFRFQAKLRDLRTSKSLQSQNQQTIFRCFPLCFPWLSILKDKLNDIGRIFCSKMDVSIYQPSSKAYLFANHLAAIIGSSGRRASSLHP